MDAKQEQDCLALNPFEGDRSPVKTFFNGFRVAAKRHHCNVCAANIPKGSRHRAQVDLDLDDHRCGTFRFCLPCCKAMAVSWTDGGRALDRRYSLGWSRRHPEAA